MRVSIENFGSSDRRYLDSRKTSGVNIFDCPCSQSEKLWLHERPLSGLAIHDEIARPLRSNRTLQGQRWLKRKAALLVTPRECSRARKVGHRSMRHCHATSGLRSRWRFGSQRDAENQLSRLPISARDHPAGNLALSPVHTEPT
jgi:hypothetical protein